MLVIPTRGLEAAGHSHVAERYFALNDRPASSGKATLAAKEALGGPDFNREQGIRLTGQYHSSFLMRSQHLSGKLSRIVIYSI